MAETLTTVALAKWAELDRIDDAICDLYSGQDTRVVFQIPEPQREALRGYLDDILTSLRDWRARYGEAEPGSPYAERKPDDAAPGGAS